MASESLRGREVVILPDNDKPGHEHAAMVAGALQDIALRVRVVPLPGLPEKGNVSDWLTQGGDRAQLERLVAAAPAWPEDRSTRRPAAAAPAPTGFVVSARRLDGLMEKVRERAATSRPFRVGFLDDIAVGLLETDLFVLGAPTGAGKTTLAANFAQAGARVHYFALEAHENEIEMRMLFRIMARGPRSRRTRYRCRRPRVVETRTPHLMF